MMEFTQAVNSYRLFRTSQVRKNISDMRSFFGMINQLCYAFSMSKVMEAFRHLLKPGSQFLWSPELQKGFDMTKEEIVKAVEKVLNILKLSHIHAWVRTGAKLNLDTARLKENAS